MAIKQLVSCWWNKSPTFMDIFIHSFLCIFDFFCWKTNHLPCIVSGKSEPCLSLCHFNKKTALWLWHFFACMALSHTATSKKLTMIYWNKLTPVRIVMHPSTILALGSQVHFSPTTMPMCTSNVWKQNVPKRVRFPLYGPRS